MQKTPPSSGISLIDGLRNKAALSVMNGENYALTKGAHRHPHGELFFLRSGYIKSYTEKDRWVIPAGHLCWVPPFTTHGGETDNTRGVRIHLAARFCKELPKQPRVISATPLILAIADRIAAVDGFRKTLSGSEGRLLEVLYDEIEQAKGTPILLPMPQDMQLRKIAERWLCRPDYRAGLDEFASEAGMSRRSLTRNFKLATGLPVGEWRQVARLMQGIDMLAAGKSVTETAFALGYDSISSFVALCHRHTGMSPKFLARTISPTQKAA